MQGSSNPKPRSSAPFEHLRIRPATGVFAFHCPNGGARRPIEGAILKGLGVVAGVPDIIAIKDDRSLNLKRFAPEAVPAAPGPWRFASPQCRGLAYLCGPGGLPSAEARASEPVFGSRSSAHS
jgi:hypothetical protein